MDLELRTITPDELDRFANSVSVPFLNGGDETSHAYWRHVVEPERAWVVVDQGRFVANACIFTRDVTIPGAAGQACSTASLAAVSAVGVHPTHRRRGLLRRLMDAMLDDARARQEPLAGLLASESSIYGRFGFGHATTSAEVVIDPALAAMRAPTAALDLALLDEHEAAKVLPALHDDLRRARAGEADRTAAIWERQLADPVATAGRGECAVPRGGRQRLRDLPRPRAGRGRPFGSIGWRYGISTGPRRRWRPPCGSSCFTSIWSAR